MSDHGGGGHHDTELPGLHGLHTWMDSSNTKAGFMYPGWLLALVYFLMLGVWSILSPAQSQFNFNMVLITGALWMPILFGRFAMMRYMDFRRIKFIDQQPCVLLEIRVPENVVKSPRAMEVFLAGLNLGPGEGSWMKKYYWRRARPWFSFEIASFGGEVHLYVYTRIAYRRSLETFLQSQYPGVELIEATDYSRLRDPHHEPYTMFTCEYAKQRPQPIPLKSYVDFGLDNPHTDVDQKSDPFVQILELFGSLKGEEQLWLQIIVRFSKKERYRGKRKANGKLFTIADEVEEEINKIKKASITTVKTVDKDGHEVSLPGFPNPTEVQKELMADIARHAGKPNFDVGIRALYSAPIGTQPVMNPFIGNLFKPVNTGLYNELMPLSTVGSEKFNDFPWEDIGGGRQRAETHELLEFYRRRAYFHPPYRGPWMSMSNEEVATLFHIPSNMVKRSSLDRIHTRTSVAPTNLPT